MEFFTLPFCSVVVIAEEIKLPSAQTLMTLQIKIICVAYAMWIKEYLNLNIHQIVLHRPF